MAVSDHRQLSGNVTNPTVGAADDLSEVPFLDLPDDLRAGFEASAEILGMTPHQIGDAILLWMVTEHQEHPEQLPEGLGQALESAGTDTRIALDS